MKQPYIEVTYRKGKAIAAYVYLERKPDDRAAAQESVSELLVVDRTEDGRAIGIEIIDPKLVSLEALNEALASLGQPLLAPTDIAPMKAA